jgi:hypothetical protein
VASVLVALVFVHGCGGETSPGADGGSGGSGTGGTTAGTGGTNTGTGGSQGGGGGTGGRGGGTGGATTGTGGSAGRGGGGTGGGMGGSGGQGGRGGTGGASNLTCSTGSGSASTPVVIPASCGSSTLNPNPFGCTLAWGTNHNTPSQVSYLQFVTNWVGAEVRADGSLPSCSGCTWLGRVAATNLIPVYYAYMIGFYGHMNGLPDGNLGPPPNLTTGGANLIRNNRAKIIQMYATYAQRSYEVFKTKPLVWLLEGDFVQYSGTSQQNPLSYCELAQLAVDITCAIKANMPNAVVAINHSTWNPNEVTNSFWNAMKVVPYDMVWTSGAGNTNGFFNSTITATSYNGGTGTYRYVRTLTGKSIFVDTSFGASAMDNSWSNTTVANLNARISEGVVAVNVSTAPSNYQSAISTLQPSLSRTCP